MQRSFARCQGAVGPLIRPEAKMRGSFCGNASQRFGQRQERAPNAGRSSIPSQTFYGTIPLSFVPIRPKRACKALLDNDIILSSIFENASTSPHVPAGHSRLTACPSYITIRENGQIPGMGVLFPLYLPSRFPVAASGRKRPFAQKYLGTFSLLGIDTNLIMMYNADDLILRLYPHRIAKSVETESETKGSFESAEKGQNTWP